MKEIITNYGYILEKSQLFKGIDIIKIKEMLHCLDAKIIHFKKNEYIFHSGDSIRCLGLMLEGNALIIQEDFWGSRNIISGIHPGQSFAESYACSPNSVLTISVAAESDCAVLFLNASHILTVCPESCEHHNRMIRNLLADIALKNLHFNEKLTYLGQRTTRAKLLSYLSSESQKHKSFEFDIPFSRQQLADYLFVERSGLSAELSKMKKEGLLDFHKNHFILKQ